MYPFPLKFINTRLQRRWYTRKPAKNNSFVVSNMLSDNSNNDPVKPGRVWFILGWEFNLAGPNVNVNQIDTAIHLCPPDVPVELFGEGLIQIPSRDIGSFQLEFGFQTTTAAGPIGKDIGGSFLGSTTGKWPVVLREGWFISAYFLSTTNNNFTPTNGTIGSLKLLMMDLTVKEVCELGKG